jgi:hypothetical protein
MSCRDTNPARRFAPVVDAADIMPAIERGMATLTTIAVLWRRVKAGQQTS